MRRQVTTPLGLTGWFLAGFGLFALLGAIAGRDLKVFGVSALLLGLGVPTLLVRRSLQASWAADDDRRARLRATGRQVPGVVTERKRIATFKERQGLGPLHYLYRYTIEARPPGESPVTFSQTDLGDARVGDEIVACVDGSDGVTRDDLSAPVN